MLLVIEVMTLRLFLLIISFVVGRGRSSRVGFGVVFLVFGVYEAANGLGLLVGRTRSRGIDQLSVLFRLRY